MSDGIAVDIIDISSWGVGEILGNFVCLRAPHYQQVSDISMVTEAETDADLEFRAGNFDEACQKYGKLLMMLNSNAKSERIELLKKLGASQQRASQYKESLLTYEALLELQDQNGSHDAEKIVTYLKLAKAHDHCDQQGEAEVEFKIAHKLATSLLPPQHAIRKSVIGNYATWLIKTGGDKNVLQHLKREMKEALGAAPPEAKSEDTATPSTQAVLVSRDASKRPLRTSNAELSQPEQSFAPEASAADMLSNELETGEYPKFDASPSSSPHESSTAVEEELDQEFRTSDQVSNARSSLPLSANKGAHENNSGKDWSDLAIHPQSALRGSARSYFKTQSTAELDKAIKDDRSWTRRALRLAPVAICAVIFGCFVTSLVNEPSSKELPPFAQSLVGKTFSTVDSSMIIGVARDGITLTGPELKKKARPLVWKGSFSDELRLLKGEYQNYVWLTPVEHGLQDPTGLKFLDDESPETSTVRAMNKIAAEAQSFYQNNHRYPVAREVKTLYSYRNPCNNKIEPVSAYSVDTFSLDSKIKDKKLDARMMRGGSFGQETAPEPGTVAMLSVINKPYGRIELPNQPVQCQFAYLHAYDRKGEMINCPTTNEPLVLALASGITQRPEDKSIAKRFANVTVGLAQSTPPGSAIILLKYISCVLLVLALIGYLVWVRLSSIRE